MLILKGLVLKIITNFVSLLKLNSKQNTTDVIRCSLMLLKRDSYNLLFMGAVLIDFSGSFQVDIPGKFLEFSS